MGRRLMRVPLDFDYPLHRVWHGYLVDVGVRTVDCYGHCMECHKVAKMLGIPMAGDCPDFDEYIRKPLEWIHDKLSPPVGDGYQYWETTSEGSPISPVFATLEGLCEWLSEHEESYTSGKHTKEEWLYWLKDEV